MSKHYKTPILLIEFDPDRAFILQSVHELGDDIDGRSVTSKLALLVLHFPKLRLVWSRRCGGGRRAACRSGLCTRCRRAARRPALLPCTGALPAAPPFYRAQARCPPPRPFAVRRRAARRPALLPRAGALPAVPPFCRAQARCPPPCPFAVRRRAARLSVHSRGGGGTGYGKWALGLLPGFLGQPELGTQASTASGTSNNPHMHTRHARSAGTQLLLQRPRPAHAHAARTHSPHATADIFGLLKANQDEPDVDAAAAVGVPAHGAAAASESIVNISAQVRGSECAAAGGCSENRGRARHA
eukprot:366404-Chlamydomonas_euryale.AAC.13